MQRSILEFVGRERTKERPDSGERPKFVDLFCGIGGASQGALDAGYEVCLAVDACADALEVHKKNHTQTLHYCLELPSHFPLPLPSAGEHWHLHGSPPCTAVSVANQVRDDAARDQGTDLVQWFLRFAMDSTATSWSMEQVSTPIVRAAIDELLKVGSPYRNRFAYTVVDLSRLGVPQARKRLIAGPKPLIARLKRLPRTRRSVRDVIALPRGTHTRHELVWSAPKRAPKDSGRKWIYRHYTDDDCCTPVDGPGWTITARHTLRWACPGTGRKLLRMTPRETALMQTFPPSYQLDARVGRAIRGIGNALPPVVMQQYLTGRPPRYSPCQSPSLRWRPPAVVTSLSLYRSVSTNL